MHQDWNSVSESGSQSQGETKQQQGLEKKQQQTLQKKQQHESKVEQSQTHEPNQLGEKKIEPSQSKPKFLSDGDLIDKIKGKELDERKKIKIVNCRSEELVEMLRNNKLISYLKQIKKQNQSVSSFIAMFNSQQDLIAFIQQKISNKYRFFLHPYVKSARDIEKEKQYEEKRKTRQREMQQERKDKDRFKDNKNYRPKDDRKQYTREFKNQGHYHDEPNSRQRNRPGYDEDEQGSPRQLKQKDSKYQPKYNYQQHKNNHDNCKQRQQGQSFEHKPDNKQKSLKTQQYNYKIEKNKITIFSNVYSKNRIVDEIIDRKIAQMWNKIKIYVQKDGLNKVFQLCELIYNQVNYGMKTLPDQSSKDQYIEVALEPKCHNTHSNSEFSLLSGNIKKYFEKLNYKNKYLIEKDFSTEDYLKGFKQNQKEICKKWKSWILKAEGANIQKLLKLSWKLRKELYLNISITVGKRGEIPYSILEVQPESDKQKRPKPDTSVANNYLTN